MTADPIIGVIGGMGPYAGLDLVRKIFDNTRARTDQAHLPVALLSYPHRICDRSTFLFDSSKPSPVDALAEIARELDGLGATVAGIPCNTAHAEPIFGAVRDKLRASGHPIRLLHMIQETVRHARSEVEGLQRIGVLSTLAVYRLRVYEDEIRAAGLEPVLPDEETQEHVVNRTIFDPEFGIKARANPVTSKARQFLVDTIDELKERGAEAVILGCTELPLAVPEHEIHGVRMIDPTTVLARALIRETFPEKLRDVSPAEVSPSIEQSS